MERSVVERSVVDRRPERRRAEAGASWSGGRSVVERSVLWSGAEPEAARRSHEQRSVSVVETDQREQRAQRGSGGERAAAGRSSAQIAQSFCRLDSALVE